MLFKKLIIVTGVLTSIAADSVWAGSEASGGGGAIVCRDSSGKITSAEMLDIFEGKIRFGHRVDPLQLPNRTADDIIDETLKAVFGETSSQKKLLIRLMKVRANIEMLPSGVAIHTSADLGKEYAVLIKAGCHLETVGYYESDGPIKVVPDILNALDAQNQAAFYLHEAIYSIYREFAGDMDSARARQITSLLLTGTYGEKRRPILFFYDLLDYKVPS